jgi:hypothetical protein
MSRRYTRREVDYFEIEDNLNRLDGVFEGIRHIIDGLTESLLTEHVGAGVILNSLLDSGMKELKGIIQIMTTDKPGPSTVKINPKRPQGSKEQSSEEIEALGLRGLPDDIGSGTTRAHLYRALKDDNPHRFYDALSNEAICFAGQIEELMLLALEADGEQAAKLLIGIQDRICMNANDVFHQIWEEERKARKTQEQAA